MRFITLLTALLIITLSSCKEKKEVNKITKNQYFEKYQLTRDSLTKELDSIAKQDLINGFGVAIVNDHEVLYTNGFGYADRENQIKYSEHTVQHIASVSKTLIGIALMKAQEMGYLLLDDPIQKYLPFNVIHPIYPKDTITIRQLATHTSGINDGENYLNNAWIILPQQNLKNINTHYPYQRLNSPDKNMPMEDYLKHYLTKDGKFYQSENFIPHRPGARYNYSNIGATLAALIIQRATNISFDNFTQEYILNPLNMDSSGWSFEDIEKSKHSKLYRADNSAIPFYTAITYPDGMLISSSSDMAKFLVELIKGYSGEGTLLEQNSYKEFFKEQLNNKHFDKDQRNPNHPYDGDYSPAIFIGHSALGYVGHSGGDAGVGTWLYFNKEKKTGRFIVKNTDNSDNDNRAKELQYYAIWDKMNEYVDQLDKLSKKITHQKISSYNSDNGLYDQ